MSRLIATPVMIGPIIWTALLLGITCCPASGADDCVVGIIETVAGGLVGDGGPATEAVLHRPRAVAVGPDGGLYVVDERACRIRKIDPAGIITTVAGSGPIVVTGHGGYSGDGGPATGATLNSPAGVAVGADGSVYIADTQNHRIRKVDRAGIITTVAGSGAQGYSGDGAAATKADLSYPHSLALDGDGNLYIADSGNHRIRKVDRAGTMTTVAGNGEHGYSGDGGPATEASLTSPESVAAGSDGSLYIADQWEHRVRKVDPKGVITTVAGDGWKDERGGGRYAGDGGPATKASLQLPNGVTLSSDGSLYISDWMNSRVRKVDPAGVITTIAGSGTRGYSGDGGPATEAELNYACGLALDGDGNLYIADISNRRVRKVDANGLITTVAGGGLGDGGPAIGAGLSWPGSLAVDRDGSLYIADSGNCRIRKVSPAGIITTVAGTGEYGCSGDGGPATEARIGGLTGLVMAPDGSLYFPDWGHHRVRKVDPAGIITTVAGTGERGYSGDDGPALEARLNWPSGIAVGPDGAVYIADSDNHRIRKVDSHGILTTVAGTGEQGYSGDGGPATEAKIRSPLGLAMSADGSLYVADCLNHRIRKLDPAGVITTVAGGGQPPIGLGDDGPATEARLETPSRVTVGPDGSLYIADTGHHRIRKVDSDGIITTVAGTGDSEWDLGDGGPATEARLNWPQGLALGPDGSLYIGDAGNDRVRRVRWLPCEMAKTRADDLRAKAGDSAEAWREVARWYLFLDAWEQAISAAEEAAALSPEGDESTRLRAEVLAARGYIGKRDDHEARRRLIRVFARTGDPKVQREAADALVDLHLLRGERDQAIAVLNDLRTRTQDRRLLGWIDRRLAEIGGRER